MRWLGSVILVALAVGCADRDAAELERVKDVVCGCKAGLDEALATPNSDGIAARTAATACADAALKGVPQRDVRSSYRAQKVAREMLDCLAKIYERAPEPDTGEDPAKPIIAPGTSAPASARTP